MLCNRSSFYLDINWKNGSCRPVLHRSNWNFQQSSQISQNVSRMVLQCFRLFNKLVVARKRFWLHLSGAMIGRF
jgi:hypothetical protein